MRRHLERVAQALWPVLEEICASGVTVDGLSLFGEIGGRSPMRLIGRYGWARDRHSARRQGLRRRAQAPGEAKVLTHGVSHPRLSLGK